MNWRLKGAIQGALSVVPGGVQANSVLQRTVGNLTNLDGNIDRKVVCDWIVLVANMREAGIEPRGLDYLEVGTGWYPTLPVCFHLIGARSCRTYDIRRHMSEKLTMRMLRRLETHLPAIAEAGGLKVEDVRVRYDRLVAIRSLESLLQAAAIEYCAPGDACQSGLPNESVDVVFSNSVLEHVPADVIARLMVESRRVLRPGGIMIHSANCGDHYAYSDNRITAVHYLQFSDDEWKRWNNSLQYQNRLRPQDFIDMAAQAGFELLLVKSAAQPSLLAALEGMRIAPEFQTYAPEQLAATSVDFVARKAVR
jgi:SAM-dependent methyltransferase